MTRSPLFAALLALPMGACNDVEDPGHDPDHDSEVITTVALTFAPTDGGDTLEARWADPEGDGGAIIDPIVLDDDVDYTLMVTFLNELEQPAEDLTAEIADEADEHQVFFTGSAVSGPATGSNPGAVIQHAYADQDPNGDPLGLVGAIATLGVGAGELTVTLRHLPEEDGQPVKRPGLAEDVAEGGFASIGGDDDVQVTFPLSVE
jgi:hypothetical protein